MFNSFIFSDKFVQVFVEVVFLFNCFVVRLVLLNHDLRYKTHKIITGIPKKFGN
jgi:hypothetical protein